MLKILSCAKCQQCDVGGQTLLCLTVPPSGKMETICTPLALRLYKPMKFSERGWAQMTQTAQNKAGTLSTLPVPSPTRRKEDEKHWARCYSLSLPLVRLSGNQLTLGTSGQCHGQSQPCLGLAATSCSLAHWTQWHRAFAKGDVGNGSASLAEVFDPITAATAEPEE